MSDRLSILFVGDASGLDFSSLTRVSVSTVACIVRAEVFLAQTEVDIAIVSDRLDAGDPIEFLDGVRHRWPQVRRLLHARKTALGATMRAINDARVHQILVDPVSVEDLVDAVERERREVVLARRHQSLLHRAMEQHTELFTINRHLDGLVHQRTFDLLSGLLSALEYRDTETQWHSRRVALYTHTLAWLLGIRGEGLEDIQRGALLHDIGKIGVPDHIMLKPGKLDEAEWEVMRTHPLIGYNLLESVDFLGEARKLVLEHHERFDGKGYPIGLDGPKIAIGARIFAIADTLDAMTSDRPYRKALSFDVAWNEIVRHAGTQFDPEVVAVFCSIPRREWEAAVALGQHHERGSVVDPEVFETWRKSAFVKSFEDSNIDPATAWFRIRLDTPESKDLAAAA